MGLIGLTIVVLVTVVIWVLALLILGYQLAIRQILITFVKEGTILFVNKGEDLYDIVANIRGHVLEKDGVIRDIDDAKFLSDNDKQRRKNGEKPKLSDHTMRTEASQSLTKKLLWSWFGLYLIGIPGFYSIHTFEIDPARLRKSGADAQDPVDTWIEKQGDPKEVKYLRWRFPRPVGIKQAELPGDGGFISAVVMVTCEIVKPHVPVYDLSGDFFDILDAAVSLVFENFCAEATIDEEEKYVTENGSMGMTYKGFLKLNKERGGPLSDYILGINDNLSAAEHSTDPEKRKLARGIVEAVGIRITEAYVFAWDAVGESKKLAVAVQQEQVKKAEADGVRAEAHGRGDSISIVATAEARRYQLLIEQLMQKGVNKTTAIKQAGAIFEAEQLAKAPQLQSLVQRGGGVTPTKQV